MVQEVDLVSSPIQRLIITELVVAEAYFVHRTLYIVLRMTRSQSPLRRNNVNHVREVNLEAGRLYVPFGGSLRENTSHKAREPSRRRKA